MPQHHAYYRYLQRRLIACASKHKRNSYDTRIPLPAESMWLLEQYATVYGIGDVYRQLVLLEDAVAFIRPVGSYLISVDRSLTVLGNRIQAMGLTTQEVGCYQHD
jgi:hypothetical protein